MENFLRLVKYCLRWTFVKTNYFWVMTLPTSICRKKSESMRAPDVPFNEWILLNFSQFLSRSFKNRPWINIEQYFYRMRIYCPWKTTAARVTRVVQSVCGTSRKFIDTLCWYYRLPIIILYSYCRFARTEKCVHARVPSTVSVLQIEWRTSQETKHRWKKKHISSQPFECV